MAERISPETLALAESGDAYAGTVLVVVAWESDQPELVAERYPGLKRAVEAEPGCLSFEVNRSTEDPRRFRVLERYADLSAFDAHRRSEHFRTLMQQGIAPLLTRREIVLHRL